MKQEEEILLKRLSEGSITAFDWFFIRYQPKVVAFLRTCIGDEEQARDIAQDIFFNIWKDRTKMAGVRSFEGYLFNMAKYSVFNYYDHLNVVRKHLEQRRILQDKSETVVEAKLAERDISAKIAETVRKMPQRRRTIFMMSRWGGYKNEDIARRLGISKRTVKNHLTAALAELRQALKYFLCVILALHYFIM